MSWACPFAIHTHSQVIKCKDNNHAELKAIQLAVSDLGDMVEIHTDSQWAIDKFKGINILVKTSRTNTANMAARAKKEKLRSQK